MTEGRWSPGWKATSASSTRPCGARSADTPSPPRPHRERENPRMSVEPQNGRPSSPRRGGGRVAIVAMGGLFPSAASPERLWAQVLAGADAAREVPRGRWLLDPRDAYDPAIARPDRVYSLRGYFLDEIPLDPAGLDLPADLLARLDPVFHLALYAARQAFESGVTGFSGSSPRRRHPRQHRLADRARLRVGPRLPRPYFRRKGVRNLFRGKGS